MKLLCFLTFFLFCFSVRSEVVEIDEAALLKMSETKTHKIQSIKMQALAAETDRLGNDLKYGLMLGAGASVQTSNRDQLSPSDVVFENYNNVELGLKKKTKWGTDLSLTLSDTEVKYSGSTFYAPTLKLQAQFDLWNNLFGRADRALSKSTSKSSELAELKTQIYINELRQNLRKLYWYMHANENGIKLTQRLLYSAKKQLKDVRKRVNNSVADDSDLYRAKAQVAQRESQLASLKLNREALRNQFIEIFPELANKELKVKMGDDKLATKQITQCVKVMATQPVAPVTWSSWYEALDLLNQIERGKLDTVNANTPTQLNAFINVEGMGVDTSRSDAFSTATGLSKTTNMAGLSLIYSLGGVERKMRKKQKALINTQYEVERQNIIAKMKSVHDTAKRMNLVFNKQHSSLSYAKNMLRRRVKALENNYRQGRISFLDLVRDQDTLLSNELDIIQSKLNFLDHFFVYTTVFDKIECAFNRK